MTVLACEVPMKISFQELSALRSRGHTLLATQPVEAQEPMSRNGLPTYRGRRYPMGLRLVRLRSNNSCFD